MKFIQDTEINQIVKEHLKIIVEESKKFKEIKSIVLYGSFSRGLGDIQKIENKFYFISDYDLILVIEDKPLSKNILEEIKNNSLKKMRNPGKINVKSFTRSKFKEMLPFYKYYEIKNFGKILYGEDVLKLIPEINSKEIIYSDIFTMFFDRVKLLLQYAPKKRANLEYKLNCMHNLSEFFIIANMCLLALKKKLDLSMGERERAVLFKNIYKKEFPELYKKIQTLGKEVLDFTELRYSDKNVKNWIEDWFFTRRVMLTVLNYILKEKYKVKKLSDFGVRYLDDYIRILSRRKLGFSLKLPLMSYFAQAILNLSYNKKVKNPLLKNISKYSFAKVYSGMVYSILSVNKDLSYKEGFLKKSLDRLKEVYPLKEEKLDFSFLQEKYLEVYNSFLGKAKL